MIYKILLLLEFPQNLIGLIGTLFYRKNHKYIYKNDALVIKIKGIWGAVTLGKYIFADDNYFSDKNIIAHEYGHRLQSRILLFLYIPVIGIPSLIWAGCFQWYRKKFSISYYSFYTEKWANELADIDLK